jgi:hypothetical protein
LFRTRLTASGGGGGGEKVLQREILAGAIIATPYVSAAAPVQVAAGLYLPLCLSYITAGGV